MVSEPNYHTETFFTEDLLAIENEKNSNTFEQACLHRFINIRSEWNCNYKFWYDYVRPKYDKKTKLCYMDTDCFITHIKTDNIYKDIAERV